MENVNPEIESQNAENSLLIAGSEIIVPVAGDNDFNHEFTYEKMRNETESYFNYLRSYDDMI